MLQPSKQTTQQQHPKMKNQISYLKPLRIQVGASTVKVGEITPCCGMVRVQGWIEAPSKSKGFDISHKVGAKIGVKCLGGYCDAETDSEPVSFPFSFDVSADLVRPSYRREERDETIARVILSLERAKRYFTKQSRVLSESN